jgi:hypothetical protein
LYEYKIISPEGHEVISVEEKMYIFCVGVSSWLGNTSHIDFVFKV